ncbi:hypothetical protein KVR01_009608 [Diaporthe batatas]|uniref:uncharacterized protein n=1 Tax=Diaporthe batatas TaxID=748121 RepID=UPI001D05336B|nr:uncharacterized protein KVR01_009608 [Diaporthe batatas]KAG8161344.1 hypothetical protein KVR01_009608 [Diaporthe batatas]
MPPNSDPRHRVWSVHRQILGYQLVEKYNLSDPQLGITTKDVETVLTDIIRGLAQGWDQKTLRKELTPPVCLPLHRDILTDLSSWVFATQGVLSHIYQPIFTPSAAEAGLGALQRSGVVAQLDDQNWGPPTSQSSSLLQLPNELFDKVLKYLPAEDANDLRLTCRESRQKSFDCWSKTFFGERQFMIDAYSLQTLLDISRHPVLRSVLTHLIIGVDEINTKDTLAVIHRSYDRNAGRATAMFRYWRDAAASQEALLRTGRAIELLSEALSNLTELQVVSVTGSTIPRDAPDYPRAVYYPDLGLHSYGATAYQMQPRDGQYLKPNSKGFPDKVFSCVLNSVVRSSPPKLVGLQTYLDNHGFLPHLKDEAFYLPPLVPPFPGRLTFLDSLTDLHLDVNLESKSMRRIVWRADHQHSYDPCNASLRQLLCACYNLENVTLSVFMTPKFVNHCDFTAWLAETDNTQGDPLVRWPSLRRLVLRGMYMSPTTLRKIFVKFDTLKSAALDCIVLRECFEDHPIVQEDSQEPLKNHWATFFRESGHNALLSNLESLNLKNLEVGRYRKHSLVFVQQTDDDTDGVVFVLQAPQPGDEVPVALEVTDFRKEALETVAEQTWFLSHWKLARDPPEDPAEPSESEAIED